MRLRSRGLRWIAGCAIVLVTAGSASAAVTVEVEPRTVANKQVGGHGHVKTPGAQVEASSDACARFGAEAAARHHGDTSSLSATPAIANAACRAAGGAMTEAARRNGDVQTGYDAARAAAAAAQASVPRAPEAPGPVSFEVGEILVLPHLETPRPPTLDLPDAPRPPVRDAARLVPDDAPATARAAPAGPSAAPAAASPSFLLLPAADDAPDATAPRPTPRDADGAARYSPMAATTLAPRTLAKDLPHEELVRHVAAGAVLTVLVYGALGLYHRLAPSEQLNHPARRAIYEAVAASPGLRLAGVARATGVHAKTARYHAEALVAARVLARDPAGGYRVPGAAPGVPLAQRLLAHVRESPGIHVSELARRAGVSKACAQTHVTDLLLAGALESRSESGARRLFAIDGELA